MLYVLIMFSHADSHRVYLPAHVPSYWLKRTVAQLWYCTYKGGLLVCCLVSLRITVPSPFCLSLCPRGFWIFAVSSFLLEV